MTAKITLEFEVDGTATTEQIKTAIIKWTGSADGCVSVPDPDDDSDFLADVDTLYIDGWY